MRMHPIIATPIYAAQYLGLLIGHVFMKPKPIQCEHSVKHLVLLLPGFLGPRSVLNPLQERLEEIGLHAVSLNIGLYSLSFQTAMKVLLRRICQLRKKYPDLERLDIVGHSMGGLIALLAIKAEALAGLTCRLVTLGTPVLGTWAALLGCGLIPATSTMLPPFQTPTILAHAMPFLSIAGEFDLLAPPNRCRHPQARYLLMKTDHAGLLYDETVAQEVITFLKS